MVTVLFVLSEQMICKYKAKNRFEQMFVHFPPDEKIGLPQEKKDDLFMEQKKCTIFVPLKT